MNKKAFIGVTAIAVVTGAVAGAIYYRHTVVEKLDGILTTRLKEGLLVRAAEHKASHDDVAFLDGTDRT